jgi:hypothetical protein
MSKTWEECMQQARYLIKHGYTLDGLDDLVEKLYKQEEEKKEEEKKEED